VSCRDSPTASIRLTGGCPTFDTLTPEAPAWVLLADWVPVGWSIAPPRFLPAADEWLIVAYNVRGCPQNHSYARRTNRDRLEAIACLSIESRGGTDDACVRAQHRRRN